MSDNTHQVPQDSLSATASEWLAASFTADAIYTDATLEVLLAASDLSGTGLLSLYSSDASGLLPDSPLATFAQASTTDAGLAFTLSGIDLLDDTSYWLVLTNTDGSTAWSWTASSDSVGAGFTGIWANSDDAGADWFINSTLYPLQASVQVSVASVPEPVTAALWLGVFPVLFVARRRRAALVRPTPLA